MPRLRRPKEITYPENPWQGIARVTVRRRDYRFDGKWGTAESIEQHAEWVRIYDETGTPPEIATVRASLLVQREGIPLPTECHSAPQVAANSDFRFGLAIATAIGCTLLLSGSLLMRASLGESAPANSTAAAPLPQETTFVNRDTVPTRPQLTPNIPVTAEKPFQASAARIDPLLASRLESLTADQASEYFQIVQQQGHMAALQWLSELDEP
jgi:hypothetical protein